MLGLSDIARIFEEIEMLLVRSLKRNLSRHKKEEEQEDFNWSAWQAEKLREIDRFRQENAQTVADFADQIDQETRQIMQEQFDEGVNGAEVPPSQPVEDAPAQITPQPQFFGVDDTKVNKLIDDVTHLEKNVETAALRTMDDVYRQVVNKAQIAMSTGAMTLQQAIDSAVSDFLARGIDCIVYRDGRRVNIADYVRMALRTTATRAGLQGKSAKYKAMGYDTVLVSSYGMCSPTCAPWQGRIYIEDTFSMWDGEVQEYPDGTLWGKSNYCGKWFPLLSSAIEHGLFHPNCRHSINFWKDGDPIPESIDNTDSERRYKLEQKQRALEREVRRAKRKVEGFSDPENIRKAKAELKAAQKKLKDFIDQTNAAEGKEILKRDKNKEKIYGAPSPQPQSAPAPPVDVPDTPKVTTAEVTLDAPQAPPDAYRDTPVPEREGLIMSSGDVHEPSIDKSAETGIINLKDDNDLYKPVTQEAIDRVPKLDIFDDDEMNKRHQQAAKDLLSEVMSHEDIPVGTEFSIRYDKDMKPINGENYLKGVKGSVPLNDLGVPFHAFHNHASNGTLSYNDLRKFASIDNMLSLTAQGYLGNTFTIVASDNCDKKGYRFFIKKIGETPVCVINGQKLSLDFLVDPENEDIVNNIFSHLSTDEKTKIGKVISSRMEKCLNGGIDYGIKYCKT